MTDFRARAIALLLATVLTLGACGGDEKAAPANDSPQATEDVKAESTAVIAKWVEAQRVGDAEMICSLETEAFQQFKYNGVGKACLDNLANNTEQAVYLEDPPIEIVRTAATGATAEVLPSGSGVPQTTTVEIVDGEYLISGNE